MVPMDRIGLSTSPLPRECSTTELHGQQPGAGEGNRTLVVSLENFCSTIELHPHFLFTDQKQHRRFCTQNILWWRGKDSNLRRQSRQIYSLIPLTAREPLQTKVAIILIMIIMSTPRLPFVLRQCEAIFAPQGDTNQGNKWPGLFLPGERELADTKNGLDLTI